MFTLAIDFKTDSAAFSDAPQQCVRNILDCLVDTVAHEMNGNEEHKQNSIMLNLRDANGNKCGVAVLRYDLRSIADIEEERVLFHRENS
jgi:hypothetical protein